MFLRKDQSRFRLSLLLLLALHCGALTPALRAQDEPAPVTVAPAPTASSIAVAPRGRAAQTIEELRAQIQEVLRRPTLAPAQVGIAVASLDTGRVIFTENADKLLMPASTMKLYTVAAALDRLSPDFRFTTSVYAPARPDASGTLRGDLIIYGRGDPSFAARFNDGDYFRAINDLAARIAAAGVRRIEGDLIGDESYFTGAPYGEGWGWDQLQWWYGAEVSALSVNDNSIELIVRPGARAGAPCLITTNPGAPLITVAEGASATGADYNAVTRARTASDAVTAGVTSQSVVTVTNRAMTAPRGATRTLRIERALGQNGIVISGQLPQGDAGFSGNVAISQPALMFVSMLRAALGGRGIAVTGRARTMDADMRDGVPLNTASLVEIASRQSPPLSEIAARTLKPSQNLYAELILRSLGANARDNNAAARVPLRSSADAGLEVVRAFLREAGVDGAGLTLTDGSGLSWLDLVTANSTMRLLTYMSRHRYATVFRDALPIAGVDGTLRNRMRGTPAANNARAKTGTINSVSALGGYVTSAAGERLVFSIMLNHYPSNADAPRSAAADAITVLLASFAGRSQPQ